jgi:hypothetical protein
MGVKTKARDLKRRYGDLAHLRVLEAIARAENDPLNSREAYWRKVLSALDKQPRSRGTLTNDRKDVTWKSL